MGTMLRTQLRRTRCHVAWVATRTGRLFFLRSSAQKEGVLPISQQSLYVLASLAYHDYEGVALHDEERPRLAADLGEAVFLMLRNHGLLTIGGSRAGPPARRVVCATSEYSPRRS